MLSLKNRIILHPRDHEQLQGAPHVLIVTGPSEAQQQVFTVEAHDQMMAGYVGFSLPQRKWVAVDINADIEVSAYRSDPSKLLSSMVVAIDFFNKKKVTQDNYDTDQMANEFLQQFPQQCFVVGQPIVFQFKK